MTNMTKTTSFNNKPRRFGRIGHHTAMHDESGQAFVELALSMTILILLLTGAAEFGRLAYAGIEVSNAARAGVAYGAQNHITASDNAGMQSAAVNDGPNVGSLTATATSFCTCSSNLSSQVSCVATSCTGGARLIEYVQVNTSAAVNPLLYVPGLPKTYTLRGQAIMRVVQ